MNMRWQIGCRFVNNSPRGRGPVLRVDRLRSVETQNGIDSLGDAGACIQLAYCAAKELRDETTQAAPAGEQRLMCCECQTLLTRNREV